MQLTKLFLEQLEDEVTASRKVLERVPEGNNDWKPHEKSMALGYLAGLVASMPNWVAMMIERDQVDLSDKEGETLHSKAQESRQSLLDSLNDGAEKARKALENTNDEHLKSSWKIVAGDQILSSGFRYKMIATSALSHMAHHRGQLTVYLRLLNEKVPAIYGPSADENF